MESKRPKTLLLTIYLCFVFILFKLFYWQIFRGQELHDVAISQIYKLNTLSPQQGHVLSSDNFPLSLDFTSYTASLYKPNFKKSLSEIVAEIEQIKPGFATENAKIISKLETPSQKWVELYTQFSRDDYQKLQKIDGLDFETKQSRIYPENSLAKNLILNLQLYYKRLLSGQVGFSRSIIDGTGENLLTKKSWQKNEIDGQDLKTSINRQIQLLSENLLKDGVDKYQADSASLIIIKPSTGEILAIAAYSASPSASQTKIDNIANLFEPGSIFKPLVVASALDSKSISTDFVCQKCNQARQIGQYTINNWDEQFHPDSSLRDIIKNSDNIGMSYIIDELTLKKFLDYFHRLKLDQKTGVDLTGESVSSLKSYWPDIDFATASFGQGFAVNQLQMIQAFNTLANRGSLVKVHLNSQSKIENNSVFSATTTEQVIEILRYAVEHSPLSALKPSGMEVCAKSGTAQVAISGNYNDANTIGSYIGFSPCENPKFTMIITVNNPRSSLWGSSTAAPMWFELAQKIEPLL